MEKRTNKSSLMPHWEVNIENANLRFDPNTPEGWTDEYVPNFGDWQAGDIVLVRTAGTIKDLGISAGQVAIELSTEAPTEFVHAGIYAGDGEIVDITKKNSAEVRSLSFYSCINEIAVLRLRNLAPGQGKDIVEAAKAMRGSKFSIWPLLRSHIGTPAAEGEEMCCSELVQRAVRDATGIELNHRTKQDKAGIFTPSMLASSPSLMRVSVHWSLAANDPAVRDVLAKIPVFKARLKAAIEEADKLGRDRQAAPPI